MESVLETCVRRNELPPCIAYSPSLVQLDKCNNYKVEDGDTRGTIHDTRLLEGNYFTNVAKRRIPTNLKQELRGYAY